MAELPSVYVLDTFAVPAHFQAEKGGGKVKDLMERAERKEISLAMSWINVGEMVYIISREQGRERAEAMLTDLQALPIKFYEATEKRILASAWLKSRYPISYADAFGASLAQELGASLVTGDPEFKNIKEGFILFWLER